MKIDHFDYIIIGAGSAGCVLANRLGQNPSKSILIVEAGPPDRNLMIHVPAGVYSAYRDPRINWNYKTEAEAEAHQRQIEMPRGRVVGGSSSINSMVYMRGHPLDYDRWESECGLTNWSFANCLPYFRSGEKSDRGASPYRGGSGPLGVTQSSYQNPLIDALLASGEPSGQGRSDDLNGYHPEGIARLDATRWNGKRCSAAVAYLRPALKRSNISLLTDTQVTRIQISGTRATGIEFIRKGAVGQAEGAEIILSGGSINSPQLLMLSGIGPSKHLKKNNIPLVIDLPGVGQNLQDHATVVLQTASTKSFDIHRVGALHNKALAGARWMLTKTGIATSNIWEAGGLVKSHPNIPYPDLQYHFAPVGFEYKNDVLKLRQAFSMHVDLLRPKSRGEVLLNSANPLDKPLLYFNYLSQNDDLETLVRGVKLARDLFAQAPFDPYRGAEIDPGPSVQSDADIARWIRQNLATDYHPSCTCKMGTGPGAVVDLEFKVHGIDGLRVVDASVMPQILSANLNAPTQMIAARAADIIAKNPQKPPEVVNFSFNSTAPTY